MELYSKTSYEISKLMTLRYSSSFGLSSKLFPSSIRAHIYAIYGLVRVADEIVDTYGGKNSANLLNQLELDVYQAIDSGYSTNPVVQSFALTAREFGINESLIRPFFSSMSMDLLPKEYTKKLYREYIYGSAEVVGLMSLKIFVANNSELYEKLTPGARALGSAFQKVNFLRDIAADFNELGRIYFPGYNFGSFDEHAKDEIITEIETDFSEAKLAIELLPASVQPAVRLSFRYYSLLLNKIKMTPITTIKEQRVRVPDYKKAYLFATAKLISRARL